VEEWQRRMVDPNWGGGKFGSYPGFAGPVGTAMLLGALPGMGYRQAFASSRLLPRFLRGRNLSNQVPFIPHAPGGSVVRGVRFGDRATPQDMAAHFSRPPGAVRPTRGIIRSAFKPKPSTLGYSQKLDQSLKGVRPYRGPRGIGLYKGRRTGPAYPPRERGMNPFQRAGTWWRHNNPWM